MGSACFGSHSYVRGSINWDLGSRYLGLRPYLCGLGSETTIRNRRILSNEENWRRWSFDKIQSFCGYEVSYAPTWRDESPLGLDIISRCIANVHCEQAGRYAEQHGLNSSVATNILHDISTTLSGDNSLLRERCLRIISE